MSVYQKLTEIGLKFLGKDTLFKYGFNWSPMYKRSTAKITEVSKDLMNIKVKLPISYKNKNYVNSIFGGSMFSAVDPIPMIQLMNILGNDYVVWDKSAEISFRRPAKENLYADFSYTSEEIESIKKRVQKENEIDVIKTTHLTNKDSNLIFCEV
ncbi:MAG: PaaI family thioesterase, partial [Saprospiraceae bacterium]